MSKFTFRYLQIRNLYYCTYIETFIQITQPCCYVSPDSQRKYRTLTHTHILTHIHVRAKATHKNINNLPFKRRIPQCSHTPTTTHTSASRDPDPTLRGEASTS